MSWNFELIVLQYPTTKFSVKTLKNLVFAPLHIEEFKFKKERIVIILFKGIIIAFDGYLTRKSFLKAVDAAVVDKELMSEVSYVKINDALHLSFGGPSLVKTLKKLGLKPFVDLKARDTNGTLANTMRHYTKCPPDLLTVSESCSARGFVALRRECPNTKLAIVSALTDIGKEEFKRRYAMSPEIKILNDILNIQSEYELVRKDSDPKNAVDMIICSPFELEFLNRNLPEGEYEFTTPGIRDKWMDAGQQERAARLQEAIDWGATYAVIGAQLFKGNPDKGVSKKESQRMTFEIIHNSKQIVEINPYKGKTIEEILEICNAVVVNNHFVYKAGEHGPAYVNKDEVYTHPEAIFEVGLLMAKKIIKSFDCSTLHCVVGPATAGAILTIFVGFHLNRLLKREILTAYVDKDGDSFILKRGYDKKVSGYEVLAIDDVVNSGESLKGVINEIRRKNGVVEMALSLCNRGGVTADKLGLEKGSFFSLMDIEMDKYNPESCPLCAVGIPINVELGHGKAYLEKKNQT